MKAYYFVPASQADEIMECGLEISRGDYFVSKFMQNSGRCFAARLHPGDYAPEAFSTDKTCLKIDLTQVRSFIAEDAFWETDMPEENKKQWFEASFLPTEEYRLGTYRKPLCLIANTILPQAMELYDTVMDEALLYESSQELYLSGLMRQAEEDPDFRELALGVYLDSQAAKGKMQAFVQKNSCVYFDTQSKKPYILRKGS